MRHVTVVSTLLLIFSAFGWTTGSPKENNAKQATLRKEAKISMRQAQKTALAKEPGTVKSKELEKENGKLIYSFDIATKSGIHEVNVDAITGSVVEDSVESRSAEAKEKQQDAQHHRRPVPKPPSPQQ